jgi:hypothetical protein
MPGVLLDLISHPLIDRPNLSFRALCPRRIFEVTVDSHGAPRKDGALFPSVIANGYHIVEREVVVLFDTVGCMMGYIEAYLGHHGNRFGIETPGFDPGAEYLRSGILLQKSL